MNKVEQFYDVQTRQVVTIPVSRIEKTSFVTNQFSSAKSETKYYLRGETSDWRKINKPVSKEYWDTWQPTN